MGSGVTVGMGVGNGVCGANVGLLDGALVGVNVGVAEAGPHLASANAFVNSYWKYDELVKLVAWKESTALFWAVVICKLYVTVTWPFAQTVVGAVEGAPVGEIVGESVTPVFVGAAVGEIVGDTVGCAVVGVLVGEVVGDHVGEAVGVAEGA